MPTSTIPKAPRSALPDPSVVLPPADLERLAPTLRRELRSNHAGETGAVAIYRGMLAVSRDPAVRAFARDHLRTEEEHLAIFETILPPSCKTRLRRLCALAGWLTGALPALAGRRAAFATIDAVETFVDSHYQAQIDALEGIDQPRLRALLKQFQADEVHHRDDARGRSSSPYGRRLRAWLSLVTAGSKVGVAVARRL